MKSVLFHHRQTDEARNLNKFDIHRLSNTDTSGGRLPKHEYKLRKVGR